jgi:hypothetical protein
MFDQLSADILASLIKGFPTTTTKTTTTTTTKQNVDPAVYYVYSRVKRGDWGQFDLKRPLVGGERDLQSFSFIYSRVETCDDIKLQTPVLRLLQSEEKPLKAPNKTEIASSQ